MNNVSHESENKTTASIQFFNLFPFYTKIKTSLLLYLPLVKQVGYNKCSYLTFYEKYLRETSNKNFKIDRNWKDKWRLVFNFYTVYIFLQVSVPCHCPTDSLSKTRQVQMTRILFRLILR